MSKMIRLIVATCLLWNIAYADNAEPILQEFYAGSEIIVNEDKPLQQTMVPYHVYEMVKSQNLNDIRVFNAASGLVPHRVALQKKDSQTSIKSLSFAKLTRNTDGLENLIEKYKASGVDISLSLRAMDTDNSNSKEDVYIGEVDEVEGIGIELKLDWVLNQEVSAFFTADIDMTDDFISWQRVAKDVNLAQLKTNDAVIKHNQVKLDRFDKKFYRVSIRGERRPDINKIQLMLNQQQDIPYEISKNVTGTHDENDKQISYYQLPAKIIKKQIKVQVLENNVMADCRVYSRDADDNTWTLRGSGTVYRITNNGETLKNEIIELRASSDREWKLEVVTRGSGFEQQSPMVNFMWQPHVLTFVARGDNPFVLAYGSAAYASQSVSQNSFFNTASNDEAQLVAHSNVSGKVDILGGEDVLKEDLIKTTPKNMILWGVLILGSLLLLFMAMSMLKSTSNDKENT
jgi:hypothetical protein